MTKRIVSTLLAALLLFSSAIFAFGTSASAAGWVTSGSYVYFGNYDQDGDSSKEPIQWLVLTVSGDKALLISRYGLECKAFNTNSAGQTWSNCSLRKWLNGAFYKAAFSKTEREAIQYTYVDESYEQCCPSFAPARLGNDTYDYVFILSYAEAVRYLGNKNDRMCIPTEHAVANGGNRSSQAFLNGRRTCWYWLRSPAYRNNAMAVDWNGTYESGYISQEYGVVRPCIWVDINMVF